MRINPVNNAVSYRGITSVDKKVPEELFGAKEKEFQALSDAKNLDVWALALNGGCMVNPKLTYAALIQDKNGTIIKQLECTNKEKSKEELNQKLFEALVWVNADKNISAATEIQNSAYAKENPKRAQLLQEVLCKTGTSNEAGTWKKRLDSIV